MHLPRIICNSKIWWGGESLTQTAQETEIKVLYRVQRERDTKERYKSRVPLPCLFLGRTARIFNKKGGKFRTTLVLLYPLSALESAVQMAIKSKDRLPLWVADMRFSFKKKNNLRHNQKHASVPICFHRDSARCKAVPQLLQRCKPRYNFQKQDAMALLLQPTPSSQLRSRSVCSKNIFLNYVTDKVLNHSGWKKVTSVMQLFTLHAICVAFISHSACFALFTLPFSCRNTKL